MKYWFYAKVEFPKPESTSEVCYPLAAKAEMFEHTDQPESNKHAPGFRSCENAFTVVSRACEGRDLVEEFIAANVWLLSRGWYPLELKKVKFTCLAHEKQCPVLGLKKPEGSSDHAIVFEVERDACNLLGPWNRKEYDSFMAVCKHGSRINHCFEEMQVAYEACVIPPPPPSVVDEGLGMLALNFPRIGRGRGKQRLRVPKPAWQRHWRARLLRSLRCGCPQSLHLQRPW